MKSKKASVFKRSIFLTPILCLALIVTWQVAADAVTTVRFGDNTVDDFPGTVEEAVIYEGLPDNNYGGRVNFQAGEPGSTTGTTRSLIRFRNIASSIGSGKKIISATMYLYCFAESSTTDYSVSAYRVLLNWGEGTQDGAIESGSSCWNYAQYTSLPWNTAGCGVESDVTGEDSTADRRATAEDSTTITGTGWFSWNLTAAVQNWYSGAWKEYGVILKSSGEGTLNSLKQFASSENVNDGYRPYLKVTYYTEGAGSTLEVCMGGCPYNNIQAALAAANPGDTVKVMDSATYTSSGGSPIKMKTGVDLVANTGQTPVINGQSYAAVVFKGPLNNCTLDGFTIIGGMLGNGGQIDMDGSAGAVTNVTVQNCKIDATVAPAPEGPGIKLQGAVAPTIRNTQFIDSYASCIATPMAYQVTYTSFPIRIEGCDLTSTGSGGLGGTGIRIVSTGSGPIYVIIQGSTIYQNPRAGISLENLGPGSVVTIDNNTIENNGGTDQRAGIYIENVASATITRNTIRNNTMAGICINGSGVDQDITIGGSLVDGNDIYLNDMAGVNFGGTSLTKGTFLIKGNNIYNNLGGGIFVRRKIIGKSTITQNDIYQNTKGGIALRNDCELEITKNHIRNNGRGGIHTGEVNTFDGTLGASLLTIRQNKVHENQHAIGGGGIDVRHASGTIENNLIYENARGGIRFGDYITEIKNNTVANNGNVAADRGGGIIYDDLAGAVNDPPSGNPPGPLTIKNNICAYNVRAGIRACFDNSFGDRDYNLLYDNWYGKTILGYNYGDCSWTGWPGCIKRQLGGCWPKATDEIFGDPLFETGTDNYHLQSGSLAEGAGDDLTDMGCYGGDYPIVDSEIP